MTPVSVLIPYRASPDRDRLLDYVIGWWYGAHPDWQVVVGFHDDGPWVKAHAVADALARASGELLVLADADVLCTEVGEAVGRVLAGAPWAVPHRRVYRLSPDASEEVLGGGPLPEPLTGPARTARRQPGQRPARVVRGLGPIRESHTGVVGGGLTILPRRSYERVPLDPQFVGWGHEDSAAGLAWTTLLGPPWRGTAPLWHLHHPPQERRTRALGSTASHDRLRLYRTAAGYPTLMAGLAEVAAPNLLPAPTDAGRTGRGPTTL